MAACRPSSFSQIHVAHTDRKPLADRRRPAIEPSRHGLRNAEIAVTIALHLRVAVSVFNDDNIDRLVAALA